MTKRHLPGHPPASHSPPFRSLTPKQRAFVERFCEGHSRTHAARLAGYADPSHAQAELMNSPAVLRALAFAAHGSCVASRRLLEQAKRGLDYVLDPDNYAPQDGSKPTVRPAEAMRAAAVVFNTLARMAPELLRADMDEDGDDPDDDGSDDGSLESCARRLLEPV